MWKRVVFDIVAVVVVFFAPWWVVLAYVIVGVAIFPWYLEAVFLGLFFDVMYGTSILPWYERVLHTFIFLIPLGIGEYIKSRINV